MKAKSSGNLELPRNYSNLDAIIKQKKKQGICGEPLSPTSWRDTDFKIMMTNQFVACFISTGFYLNSKIGHPFQNKLIKRYKLQGKKKGKIINYISRPIS